MLQGSNRCEHSSTTPGRERRSKEAEGEGNGDSDEVDVEAELEDESNSDEGGREEEPLASYETESQLQCIDVDDLDDVPLVLKILEVENQGDLLEANPNMSISLECGMYVISAPALCSSDNRPTKLGCMGIDTMVRCS